MANIIADHMAIRFEELSSCEFYREIFGEGNLDDRGNFTKGKYVGVAIELGYGDDEKVNSRKKHIITDDLDTVDELTWESNNFCMVAPISYAGWSRKTENARTMFALGVEIDNLHVEKRADGTTYFKGLETLIHQWNTIDKFSKRTILPKPTFLVASGNGVHLYYQFETPLRLTEWVKKSLMLYKEKLTRMLWNQYITKDSQEEKIQFESAFQAFRMVGSATRRGLETKNREDRCRAFRVGDPITVDYLNSFLDSNDIRNGLKISPTYEGKITLSDAKEKWPDWYQTVVVEGKKYTKKWDIAGKVNGDDPFALYHWWLNRIRSGAVVGKRYHCMYCLAVYAIKNDVPEEKLVEDCYELMDLFDSLTPDGADSKEHFTESDVEAALQVFEDEGYFNYPIRKIIKRSGIQIERNPRNYRKRADHLHADRWLNEKGRPTVNVCKQNREMALQYMRENGEIMGRPQGSKNKKYKKQEQIQQYRSEHPDASVTDVARSLGISRTTVYKWWDAPVQVEPEQNAGNVEDLAPAYSQKARIVQNDARSGNQGDGNREEEREKPFDWRAHLSEALGGVPIEEIFQLVQEYEDGKLNIDFGKEDEEEENEDE